MYARLITSQYQLDKLDEGLQLYRESITARIEETARFQRSYGDGRPEQGQSYSTYIVGE